jgi:hypothetical protein
MGWRRPDVGSNEHAERVPHPQRIAVVSGTLGTAIERRTGEARVLAPTGGSTQPPPMRSALSSTSRTSTAARRIGLECGHPYVSPKPAWWHSSGPFATESQASACAVGAPIVVGSIRRTWLLMTPAQNLKIVGRR